MPTRGVLAAPADTFPGKLPWRATRISASDGGTPRRQDQRLTAMSRACHRCDRAGPRTGSRTNQRRCPRTMTPQTFRRSLRGYPAFSCRLPRRRCPRPAHPQRCVTTPIQPLATCSANPTATPRKSSGHQRHEVPGCQLCGDPVDIVANIAPIQHHTQRPAGQPG